MDDSVKKGLYYLGIVAALYLFFSYILPALITLLGFAFKVVFHVFIWGAIAFVVVLGAVHLMKIIRKEG